MPTIDAAGRVVIPKRIRSAANLKPGTRVGFRVTSMGLVEIEPEPLKVRIVPKGRFAVAVPVDAVGDHPVLSQAAVDATLEGVRLKQMKAI